MKINNHKIIIILSLLISGICLWAAFRNSNYAEITHALHDSQLWMVFPLLTCFFIYYWTKAVRWKILLLPMKQTTAAEIFPCMMIGFFGNNLLPAHLGEFIRMYLGGRQLKLNYSQILATIILERIFDIFAITLFLLIALFSNTNLPNIMVKVGYFVAVLGTILLLPICLFITWTDRFISTFKALIFFLPDKIKNRITDQLQISSLGFHALKNPYLLFKISLTSIIQWGFMGLSIYIALLALGIYTSISASFVVMAFTTFAVILPSAPGYFGTIQLAFVVSLKPFGINEGTAVAASIYFHIFTYFAVLALGLYLLRHLGLKFKQLQHEAKIAESQLDISK